MKIAILHNYMDNIGGAEKVGLTLARDLKADFYTTNIDKEKIAQMGFSGISINSIGQVPVNAPFRQQKALWLFKKLNLKKKYNFYIIDGDWAVSAAFNNKPNIWYVHSPIREIWDSYKYVRKNAVPFYARSLFDIWVHYNRLLNKKYVDHVSKIICNSKNTKKRIKEYLGKDAKVIYPPVDTSKYYYKKHNNYWLSVNRLFIHKRVEIQMRAFSQLPNEKLVIVGSYEKARHFQRYSRQINLIKPKNVKILSWVDSDKLIDLYANCKGFITTAIDEDFGLTAVEAMASGKPVIAPNEGGYKETIISNKTGLLVDNISSEKLCKAIKQVGKNVEKYKNSCKKQGNKFDTKTFIEKITNEILNGN